MSQTSERIDFSAVFAVDHAFKPGVFHFDPVGEATGSEQIFRGETHPSRPVPLRVMKGSRTADLMGTTLVELRLASERFIALLAGEGFTGWSTFPVRLEGRKRVEIPGFSGLVVTGRAGPIDPQKSRIVWEPPPVPRGKGMYSEIGMYFDPGTWDGSDLFVPDGTVMICVPAHVKQAVEKAALSNVQFTPLSEFRGKLFAEPPPGREVIPPPPG